MNITLTGFMGTGKTVVGRKLARRLGWTFVDIDELIESSAKMSIREIFAEHGEAVFRRLEKRMISRATKKKNQVISTGGGAFTYSHNRRMLRAVGPVICLTATPKAILARVSRNLAKRPMLASAPSPLNRIKELLDERESSYAKADMTIDTSNLSVDEVLGRIWQTIGPLMSKSWQYLLKHNPQLSQRYAGQYISVLDEKIVGSGPSHSSAYQAIPKNTPASCEVAIYYIPLPEESSMVL
jgi:shikimate kinase